MAALLTSHQLVLVCYMVSTIFKFDYCLNVKGVRPGPSPDPWSYYIIYNRGITYMARGFNTKPWFGYILYNHCLYTGVALQRTQPIVKHILHMTLMLYGSLRAGILKRLARF